ncbi:MAG TPA: hypothetical protein VFE13_03585 [Caulobacteraceae bacterium]|jgi:hypothetical protein|nr:hypothetical protein [Caulobacteraceae bacterium]
MLRRRFCGKVGAMEVEIAEERILVLADQVGAEVAESKAWARRVEAFGALARMSGLLARPKDEEFEIVYREKRLQPFWRIASRATSKYERARTYQIHLAAEVKQVVIEGQARPIEGRHAAVTGLESCEEESRRLVLVDGLSGAQDAAMAAYVDFPAAEADASMLARLAGENTVVVPPTVKASGLVREAVAKAIGKIEADRILEEKVELEAVDLYYRPVYAFRFRRGGKEAVVEVDALTGAATAFGSTFEQHLGKILEPKFLLDIGAEAANLFIPGATVAKLAIVKGLELHEKRRAAKIL